MKVTKLACDFCSKSEDAALKLIAGPNSVCICDECVVTAVEVLWGADKAAALGDPMPPAEPA